MTERFLQRWSRLKQGSAPPPDRAIEPTHERVTPASLRQAWRTDPAIRDFVEVAENQWDFNDPAALPGFGPLPPGQQGEQIAARLLTMLTQPSPTPTPTLAPPRLEPPSSPHVDPVWLPASIDSPKPPALPARTATRGRRTGPHGGAMPADA